MLNEQAQALEDMARWLGVSRKALFAGLAYTQRGWIWTVTWHTVDLTQGLHGVGQTLQEALNNLRDQHLKRWDPTRS